MTREVETFTGPEAWACYIINGQDDNLDDSDLAACDAWVASLARNGWEIVSITEDEPRFTWHYRLYGGTAEGGSVVDYIAYKE